MGGSRFFTRLKGDSMQDAYNTAVDRAEREYGHQQGYSGEINSTGGFCDLTKEWKASKLHIDKFIQKKEDGNLTKGNAYGVCLKEAKVSHSKIKTQVEHKVEKGTKTWKLVYVVSSFEKELGSKDTKGEAVKLARAYTEKTKIRTRVHMEKVLVKGSSQVAEINYKPSKNDAPGEYVFFGIAPC